MNNFFTHLNMSNEKLGQISYCDSVTTSCDDSLIRFQLKVFLLMIVFVNRRLLYSNKN